MEREDLQAQIAQLAEKAEVFLASCGKDPIEVYRIEKFVPTRQDAQFLGKFFDGDSYVIIKRNDKDYDIHYWHGKNASGDEQATAAAFTVQLSDNLALASRHHLELMMEETTLFLSYFKSGIFYMEGGIESGFKHVVPKEYEHQLYIVKGKRYPRVWTLEMKASSLNEGDVFILDLGMKLFFWPGQEANVNEKAKGMEIIFNIKNGERGAHPEVFYPRDGDEQIEAEFWKALGGKPYNINPAVPDEGVQEGNNDADLTYSLYKVSNANGYLETTEITERPLRKDHLDTNDTFILELPKKIYVWIGKQSNYEEKKNGMLIAKDFIQQKNKPKNTQISRIPEFGEDVHFKSFFNNFYPCIKQDFGTWNQLDTTTSQNQDIDKVANQQRQASKDLFDQLQNYTMTVFHVNNGEPVVVPENEWGHFYSDDIYIIDLKGAKHRYVVMWMGPKLNSEELSITTGYMDKVTNYENSSMITRNRVRKGHEDESLLSLFPNGFFIYQGKHQSNFHTKIDSIYQNGAMFRLQAPYGDSAKAIEQAEFACSNLNSGDAFFIVGNGNAYLWLGLGSNEAEHNLGKKMFNFFSNTQSQNEFKEGEESEEFWNLFGGKGYYSSVKDTGMALGFEPRLFHCSNASGYFYVEEIFNFTQDDLINDDIMLLDAYQTIYVWIGNKSNKFEKKGALSSAQKFLDSIKDERDKDNVQTVEVEAGKEQSTFTVHFSDWRKDKAQKWLDEDPVKILKTNIIKQLTVKVEEKKEEASQFLDSKTHKFDYETLKSTIPEGVDPTLKEKYLSDSDFVTIMGMTQAKFDELKKWKQQDIKKAKGLF